MNPPDDTPIPWDEMDDWLATLGKTRRWLAEQTNDPRFPRGYKYQSVTQALQPAAASAQGKHKRTRPLQNVLSSILREEKARQSNRIVKKAPNGSGILSHLTQEQFNQADIVSREQGYASFEDFIVAAVLEKAERDSSKGFSLAKRHAHASAED